MRRGVGVMLAAVLAAGTACAWTIALGWNPASGAGAEQVTGYKLHWGWVFFDCTNSVDAGTNLVGTITNLDKGSVYRFAVSAYAADGSESPLSHPVFMTYFTNAPVAAGNAGRVLMMGDKVITTQP